MQFLLKVSFCVQCVFDRTDKFDKSGIYMFPVFKTVPTQSTENKNRKCFLTRRKLVRLEEAEYEMYDRMGKHLKLHRCPKTCQQVSFWWDKINFDPGPLIYTRTAVNSNIIAFQSIWFYILFIWVYNNLGCLQFLLSF